MNKSEKQDSGLNETQRQKNFRTIGKFTIDFGKFLGSGKYGKVYPAFPATEYEKDKRFACKMIEVPAYAQENKNEETKETNPNNKLQAEQMNKQFSHEVEALMQVSSPHVIKMIKAYKSNSRQYLITELCNGGDLNTLVSLRKCIPEEEAKIILRQIIEGLKDMQKSSIIHRDLKCANILLHFPQTDLLSMRKEERQSFIRNANLREIPFEIKISDFGFAKKIEHKSKDPDRHTICGTPAYMAPTQIVNHEQNYTDKLDIWSLGIIYYELLTGKPPFTGKNIEEFKKKLIEGTYQFSEKLLISPESILVISNCLQYQENDRTTIQALFIDPLFQLQSSSPMKQQQMHSALMSTAESSYGHKEMSLSSTLKLGKNPPSKALSIRSTHQQPNNKRNPLTLSIQTKYTLDDIKDLLFSQFHQVPELKRNRHSDSYIKRSGSKHIEISKALTQKAIDIKKNDILLDSDLNESQIVVCCQGYDILVRKMIVENYFKSP